MAQTLQHGHPVPAPDYDPETDPVLAGLRRHSASGGNKRVILAAVVVALLAVTAWFVYSLYDSTFRRVAVADAQTQAEPAPAPPSVTSVRQKAESWCGEHLGSTEFAGLPMVESDSGDFFVIYTARPGDSISAVAYRYAMSSGAGAGGEILERAKREHVAAYDGRVLWVGDQIRLRIPVGPSKPGPDVTGS
jgi:hypothetical protein